MKKVRMRSDLAKEGLAIYGSLIGTTGDISGHLKFEADDFADAHDYIADDIGNVVVCIGESKRLFIFDSIDLEFYEEEN